MWLFLGELTWQDIKFCFLQDTGKVNFVGFFSFVCVTFEGWTVAWSNHLENCAFYVVSFVFCAKSHILLLFPHLRIGLRCRANGFVNCTLAAVPAHLPLSGTPTAATRLYYPLSLPSHSALGCYFHLLPLYQAIPTVCLCKHNKRHGCTRGPRHWDC